MKRKLRPVEWKILETYESEAEARVVESLLRASGFEVELLDTHGQRMTPTRSLVGGLRLMVRAQDLEAIRETLIESQQPNHLSLVGEEQPLKVGVLERCLPFLVGAFLLLLYGWVKWKG